MGQSFANIRRLGKRVVFDVSDESSLVIEPRMTGLVLLSDPPDVEHLRIQWDFKGPGKFESLWFWDRRGLGVIRLFEPGQLQSHYGSGSLGRDALEMTGSDWIEQFSKTRREIKVVLLDQKIVAGIGNLYASEILHLAGINPMAEANSLRHNAIDSLADAVRVVLLRAIECEGSTLGDGTYRNALNQNGSYQNQHRVYMKEGLPCSNCSTGKIVRVVQAQRSTFFCPQCQRKQRKSN